MFLEIYGFKRAKYKYFGGVFVLGTLNRGGGGVQPATPFRSATQSCVFKSRSSVQQPRLLSDIGVPRIISQLTRNIGSKLVKYWPTSKTLEIHYTGAGSMRPICRFLIVLR